MSANDELQAHTCEKILQECGDVANNVAQSKVQDLTEQWKKGELEAGFYYIKGADGLFGIMSDYGLYRVNLEHSDNTISLLAKVPSYEEYSRLEWYAGCGPDMIVELNKENRQLRKWCEEFNALEVAKENEQLKLIIKRTKASGNYPSKVSQYKARITALTEENQQLKELLCKCKFELMGHYTEDWSLMIEIDNATGENNEKESIL